MSMMMTVRMGFKGGDFLEIMTRLNTFFGDRAVFSLVVFNRGG